MVLPTRLSATLLRNACSTALIGYGRPAFLRPPFACSRTRPHEFKSLSGSLPLQKNLLYGGFFIVVIPTRLSATLLRNACSTALIGYGRPAFLRPPFACSRTRPHEFKSLSGSLPLQKNLLYGGFFIVVIPTRLSATLLRNACSTALIGYGRPAFLRPPFACSRTRPHEFKSLSGSLPLQKNLLYGGFFIVVIPTRLSATLLRNACSTALIGYGRPAFLRPPFACSRTRPHEFKSLSGSLPL